MGDISGAMVQSFLADIRRQGLAIQSKNHYLLAIRQFTRWLAADGRTDNNPVALTLDVDAHVGLHDERAAIESRPGLPDAQTNRAQALRTGTDDEPVEVSRPLTPQLTLFLTLTPDSDRSRVSPCGSLEQGHDENSGSQKSLGNERLGTEWAPLALDDMGRNRQAAVGFEPTNNGFANRRLRPLGYAATKGSESV